MKSKNLLKLLVSVLLIIATAVCICPISAIAELLENSGMPQEKEKQLADVKAKPSVFDIIYPLKNSLLLRERLV